MFNINKIKELEKQIQNLQKENKHLEERNIELESIYKEATNQDDIITAYIASKLTKESATIKRINDMVKQMEERIEYATDHGQKFATLDVLSNCEVREKVKDIFKSRGFDVSDTYTIVWK